VGSNPTLSARQNKCFRKEAFCIWERAGLAWECSPRSIFRFQWRGRPGIWSNRIRSNFLRAYVTENQIKHPFSIEIKDNSV
jgi:hypothetical protein